MKKHLLSFLDCLFRAEFREIDGAVLAFLPGMDSCVAKATHSSALEKAQFENMFNHQHFDFTVGDSVWERWKNNLTLACAVLRLWEAKLGAAFPDRHFVLFIYNELTLVSEAQNDQDAFEVVPTLRMWTEKNDSTGEMYRGFLVNQATVDQIEIRQNYSPTFIPEDIVFTRTGTIRRPFLRKLQKLGSDCAGRIYL